MFENSPSINNQENNDSENQGQERIDGNVEEFDAGKIQVVYNHLQMAIISRVESNFYDLEQGDKNNKADEWIKKYSGNYKTEFYKYFAENPEFINEWQDLNKREAIIDELQRRVEGSSPTIQHAEAA